MGLRPGQSRSPGPATSADVPDGAFGRQRSDAGMGAAVSRTARVCLCAASCARLRVVLALGRAWVLAGRERGVLHAGRLEGADPAGRPSYVADAGALETAYQEGSDPADAIDDVSTSSIRWRIGSGSFRHSFSTQGEGRDGASRRRPRERPGHEAAAATQGRATPTSRRARSGRFRVRRADPPRREALPARGRRRTGRFCIRASRRLSDEALIFSVVSLLIGMSLFYVLGGRIARPAAQDGRQARNPRFAHRLGNHVVPGRARAGGRGRGAQPRAARAGARRPGRLQVHQRPLRSPPGRRGAGAGRACARARPGRGSRLPDRR